MEAGTLWAVGGLTLAALLVPGPNFVLITGRALFGGAAPAVGAASGVALGTATHATMGVIGLAAVLASVSWLFVAAKLAGSAYLIYLGVRIWRSSNSSLSASPNVGDNSPKRQPGTIDRRAVLDGWLTQMSNPKTTLFFFALFSAVVPAGLATVDSVVLVALVASFAWVWYSVVAVVFSRPTPRLWYRRFARLIQRTIGGVMILFGIRIGFADR